MGTIFAGTISNKEFKTLSELTGITFTINNTYTIQLLQPAYIREGNSTEGGFYIFDGKPFPYVATSDELYIKVQYGGCTVIISD